jgi:hypothetical protein
MDWITAQDEGGERLAKPVLSWITCAKRPLMNAEPQHVIAVKPGQSEFDKRQPDIKDIISVSAGLVTVDKRAISSSWSTTQRKNTSSDTETMVFQK